MTSNIVVIDYGIGNLFSVQRAFEECGAVVTLTSDPSIIMAAERLVLPGVGAFADGMRGLVERKLDSVVKDYAKSGRPLLGICLGMQMLAPTSDEFGTHQGLGIIPGRVQPIEQNGADGRRHKIPHIGWAALKVPAGRNDWSTSILADIQPGESVYLVHSYGFVPEGNQYRLADVEYNGRTISAAVQHGQVYGCQFHPEKSGVVGLKIARRFLSLF